MRIEFAQLYYLIIFYTQSLSITECTERSPVILGKYNLKIEFSWHNIVFLNAYRSRRRKIQETMSLLRTQPLYNHGILSGRNVSLSSSMTINFSLYSKNNLNPKLHNRFFALT